MQENPMQAESRIGRRDFLATALTAASSAFTIGLSHADAQGQEPGPQSHPVAPSDKVFSFL
jgi:hypothetical protein